MRVTIEDGVQPSNVVKRESMYDNGKGRMIRTNGTRLLLWSVKRKLHVLRRTVTFQMTLSDLKVTSPSRKPSRTIISKIVACIVY